MCDYVYMYSYFYYYKHACTQRIIRTISMAEFTYGLVWATSLGPQD